MFAVLVRAAAAVITANVEPQRGVGGPWGPLSPLASPEGIPGAAYAKFLAFNTRKKAPRSSKKVPLDPRAGSQGSDQPALTRSRAPLRNLQTNKKLTPRAGGGAPRGTTPPLGTKKHPQTPPTLPFIVPL
jgi:hypothetical protein